TGRVAQRFKRYLYFDGPSPIFYYAFRFHHNIDREIGAVALGKYSVLLYAERVKSQDIGAALVVVGVEPNADIVFAENFITFRYRRPNLVLLVPTFERDVKVLFVIHHISFGWFGW